MSSIRFFFNAVRNEIDIDKNLLKRLGVTEIGFTPLRAIKTLSYIKKYKLSNISYALLAFLFWVFSPVYYFVTMLIVIFMKKKCKKDSFKYPMSFVLVANGRVETIVNKLKLDKNVAFLNINQPSKNTNYFVYNFAGYRDFFHAYFLSVYASFILFWRLEDKKDILQFYVAYKWFLVYLVLLKNKGKVDTVFFANHYDRWAVMFDQIFADKNIVLLQHGVLPEEIDLSYKLKNINHIYALDDESIERFKRIFDCDKTKFSKYDISLNLSDIHSEKPSILIIGQPHSMDTEIKLAKQLSNKFKVFIKPHPLYNDRLYRKLKNVIVINEKDFFPRVNLAICYESTLGLEYEASGVEVLWWKGKSVAQIMSNVENYFRCQDVQK